MAAKKNITHLIERLELFEERLGVRLEALSAVRSAVSGYWRDRDVTVFGELHAKHGTTIKESICLVAAVYDHSGRVIGVSMGDCFFKKRFSVFEAFAVRVRLPDSAEPVAKVRVYPKSFW